jgi:hypothetical protein
LSTVSNPTLLQLWFGPREKQSAGAPPDASSSDEFSRALEDSLATAPADCQDSVTSPEAGRISAAATPVSAAEAEELIDVAVDIWGWDRDKVMDLRRTYGYTWVPSAYADPIQVAPGLGVPGLRSYDPNHPPEKCIRVPPA